MKNYHQAIPSSIESYRASTRDQLWLDHRRKKCYCGKIITAKQESQYGCCDDCFKKSKTVGEAA